MNLSEALEAALPEIPRNRISRDKPPRVDPELIIREDVNDGEPIVAVYQRSTANLLRMKPTQWQLARLFDGNRTYEEIAAAFEGETGIPLQAGEARTFAENMDEGGFWYKDPQEKNIAMTEKLAAQRSRRAHGGSSFNVAHIQFSAWDPDRYLTLLDEKIGKYAYNRWMVLCAVLLFVFEAVVFVVKWNVIGPDIPVYYDFTRKTISDLVEFWWMLLVIGFIHESAHGLTCKHYGGEVHSMGLMFLYLTPAFYVDVTESWVSASRLQRMATIIAGIWVEMIVCSAAVLVWTSTQPGEWLHDFCYKLILLTGIAVAVINLNPLIKLDGYYFFTEWVRVPDLKERSTAFLTGWVQRNIFRLPVDVPVVSRRRVPLFVLYALASGAYSYLLLWLFVLFSYNVLSKWFAELALLPAAVLAFFIFQSRLRSLRDFLRRFYRARVEQGAFRLTPPRALSGAIVLALLFVPLMRERLDAYFVIESRESRQVHAGVPGKILAVYVKEGDKVAPGQVMARLQSLSEAGDRDAAAANAVLSQAQVFSAELQHAGLGPALSAEQAAREGSAIAREEDEELAVRAPMAGVVTTSNPENLVNRDVAGGEILLTIIDPSELVARVYVPVSEMDRIRIGEPVSLQLPSDFSEIRLRLGTLEGAARPLPAGILADQQFKGIGTPSFYTTRIPLGGGRPDLEPGMSGQAKIFGRRRSLAERMAQRFANIVHTHFW
ncbi:MAG: HlyD family efflux transporter periplasmic adaptor subunit [Acidobacteriaceae bacterium]